MGFGRERLSIRIRVSDVCLDTVDNRRKVDMGEG
jgi:hypothetical protein